MVDFVVQATYHFSTEIAQSLSNSLFLFNSAGNYTIIGSKFTFVRRMGFYVIQVFLPTIMIVCLSWITFYMDVTIVGDRLTIAITLLLTMIFLMGYINASLPKVSYAKAIDIYLIVSLVMIILAVTEGIVSYCLYFASTMNGEMSENNSQTKMANVSKQSYSDAF